LGKLVRSRGVGLGIGDNEVKFFGLRSLPGMAAIVFLVGLSHDGWLASSGLLENNNLPNRICSKTGFSSETVTLRVFRYS